jgi:hypothetical protein
MEKKYKILRIAGTIYRILGVITLIFTIISVIGICATSVLGGSALGAFAKQYGNGSAGAGLLSGFVGGALISVFVILYGGITSITLFAFGEGISLLITVEENTRKTALLLKKD